MLASNRVMRVKLVRVDSSSISSSSLCRGLRKVQIVPPEDRADNDRQTEQTEHLSRRPDKNPSRDTEADDCQSIDLRCVAGMSNSQLEAAIRRCIKLGVENKINVKNAFGLEMIDFMFYVIKKKKGYIVDLQSCATWLDVSAEIYGYRVDGLHEAEVKLGVNLGGQERKNGSRERDAETEESDLEREIPRRARQKKRSKQHILVTAETVRINFDAIFPASTITYLLDSQSTDMLYQAILPVHAGSDLYLHPYNDVILDTVKSELEAEANNSPVDCPRLERFGHLDVCPSFANFEFLGWSPRDDEEDASSDESSFPVENGYGVDFSPRFHSEDESMQYGNGAYGIQQPTVALVDFHQSLENLSIEETDESSRWRIVRRRTRSFSVGGKAACKDVASLLDEDTELLRERDETATVKDAVLADSCTNVACEDEQQAVDENGNKALDMGYCEDEQLIDDNGNNVVDKSYCTQGYVGDNLVEAPPNMTKRILIPFAQRAQKIDMRELKKSMWINLTSPPEDEPNVDDRETFEPENADKMYGTKMFSDVCKNMPKMLNKRKAEALSVPTAFLSLLHLANEKRLKIDSIDDKPDLVVSQENFE